MNEGLLREHVKWAEAASGPELYPYKDSVGVLTIGYGRNLDDNGISRDEAELMLVNDLDAAIADAMTLPYWDRLSPVRQLVLSDMSFNLGLPRLLKFKKMHAALEVGDYSLAAHEMMDSKWYRQTERRAKVLVRAMQTGIWQ